MTQPNDAQNKDKGARPSAREEVLWADQERRPMGGPMVEWVPAKSRKVLKSHGNIPQVSQPV